MNPLPTVSQVREVKHLHSADLFGPAAIAPFRIARIAKGIKIAADGSVTGGQHRFSALLQLSAQ